MQFEVRVPPYVAHNPFENADLRLPVEEEETNCSQEHDSVEGDSGVHMDSLAAVVAPARRDCACLQLGTMPNIRGRRVHFFDDQAEVCTVYKARQAMYRHVAERHKAQVGQLYSVQYNKEGHIKVPCARLVSRGIEPTAECGHCQLHTGIAWPSPEPRNRRGHGSPPWTHALAKERPDLVLTTTRIGHAGASSEWPSRAAQGQLLFISAQGSAQRADTPSCPDTTASIKVWLPVPETAIEAFLRSHPDQDQYAFFDTHDNVRWRRIEEAWGIREVVQDAIRHTLVQPVTEVSILQRPLPDLPVVQLVLHSANLPLGWRTVPVDLRPAGFDLCTLGMQDDVSAFEAALRAAQFCRTPHALSHDVARLRWNFAPPGVDVTDPFRPGILMLEPAILCVRAPFGELSAPSEQQTPQTSLNTYSSSGTSSEAATLDCAFECVTRDRDENEQEMTVAFHSAGQHPWIVTVSKLLTPEELAALVARRMADRTGIKGWRTHCLWRQPVVRDVDLHCIVSPSEARGAAGPQGFLADFRRIFGPDIRNIAVLHTLLNTPQSADAMCEKARQKLSEWGLAQPPTEFCITTARNGALLVPEAEEVCLVTDTVATAVNFPGLLQSMLRTTAAAQPRVGGFVTQDSPIMSHCPVPTTTSTTTEVLEELPHVVEQLPPRTHLLVRLGVVGRGVFTAEFEGNPPAEVILARVWAIALGQEATQGLSAVRMTPCQPPNRVSHREILLFAAEAPGLARPPQSISVWVDFRPQGMLSFVNLPVDQSPDTLLSAYPGAKGLYVNGRKWEQGTRLEHGDYLGVSLVPQAPDIRPNDYFVQRLAGLGALLLPLPVPTAAFFETTTSLELDAQIAQHAWHDAVNTRLEQLGLSRPDGSFHFVVVGPGVSAVGAIRREQWDLQAVADWTSRFVLSTLGRFGQGSRFSLFDTEGTVAARRLLVIVPLALDPLREYVRVHLSEESVVAFQLPHSELPSVTACLAPIDDPSARPVPGRAWYGPIFPSTELHPFVNFGGPRVRWRRWQAADGAQEARQRESLHRLSHEHAGAAGHERPRPGLFYFDSAEQEVPGGTTTATTLRPTTSTTTNMLAPGQPVVFLVTGSAIAGQQLVGTDVDSVIDALGDLVAAHITQQRAPWQGQIRLAQAHPGRNHDFREIIFVWFPMDLHVHVIVDARPVGGGLGHASVDTDVDVAALLPDRLRTAGTVAYINGVPSHLFADYLQDGDYVHFADDRPIIPAYPRAALFRRWPGLSVFALDVPTVEMFPLPVEQEAALEHIMGFLRDACDARQTLLGHHLPFAQPALVMSRIRGELLIYVPCRIPATSGQVAEALALLPEWQDASRIQDTGMLSGDAPIFLARDVYESRQTWHIIPVPYMLRLFTLWPVNEEVLRQTEDLPAPPHLRVSRQPTPSHGHVHFFHHRTTEGLSMLQLHARITSISSEPGTAGAGVTYAGHQAPAQAVCEQRLTAKQNALAMGVSSGCRADHFGASRPEELQLKPDDLDLVVDRVYLAAARTMAGPAGPEDERYTVFDTAAQIQIRTYRRDQRIEWLLADILRHAPRTVRVIQRLTVPVYGYPEPQFVLTAVAAPTGWQAVPVDCRSLGLGVCTVELQPLTGWREIGLSLRVTRPDLPSCQQTGEAFLEALADARLILRDAYRPQTDPIRAQLDQLQWLFVAERPPVPPVPSASDSDDRTVEQRKEQQGHSSLLQPGNPVQGGVVAAACDLIAPAPRISPSGQTLPIPTPLGRRCIDATHGIRPSKTVDSEPRKILHLATLLPEPEPGWLHGVNSDMLEHALEAHSLSRLHTHFWDVTGITLPVLALWSSLPAWDEHSPVSALYIFTDGSYCPNTETAAWAVVVVALQQTHIVKVGVQAGFVRQSMGRGAYDGETEALLHARAIALANRPVPAFIGSDCASALAATHAFCALPAEDPVVRGAAGLAFASAAHGQRRLPLQRDGRQHCQGDRSPSDGIRPGTSF